MEPGTRSRRARASTAARTDQSVIARNCDPSRHPHADASVAGFLRGTPFLVHWFCQSILTWQNFLQCANQGGWVIPDVPVLLNVEEQPRSTRRVHGARLGRTV